MQSGLLEQVTADSATVPGEPQLFCRMSKMTAWLRMTLALAFAPAAVAEAMTLLEHCARAPGPCRLCFPDHCYFAIGGAFGYFVAFPLALNFLLEWFTAAHLTPLLTPASTSTGVSTSSSHAAWRGFNRSVLRRRQRETEPPDVLDIHDLIGAIDHRGAPPQGPRRTRAGPWSVPARRQQHRPVNWRVTSLSRMTAW